MNDIDGLRATAAAIMNSVDECWPTSAALIQWTAQQLMTRHPGTREADALIVAERGLLAGWS